jgi:hypothetical protein
MATLTRVGTPSLATTVHDPGPHQIHGRAAVDLTAGDMVYLTSTGTLAKANGTAADALALSVGMVLKDSKSGEKAVAWHDVEVCYGSAAGLVIGTRYFVSATAGALDDAATLGGTVAVAFATTSTNIYILSPNR